MKQRLTIFSKQVYCLEIKRGFNKIFEGELLVVFYLIILILLTQLYLPLKDFMKIGRLVFPQKSPFRTNFFGNNFLTPMLLVANLANTKGCKISEK